MTQKPEGLVADLSSLSQQRPLMGGPKKKKKKKKKEKKRKEKKSKGRKEKERIKKNSRNPGPPN